MKTRILGLDTGTNSLGWAVVDRDENNQYTPICRGDLIFTEGVKQEKGIEFSLAAERTSYRASRRPYFRRRQRSTVGIRKKNIRLMRTSYSGSARAKLTIRILITTVTFACTTS